MEISIKDAAELLGKSERTVRHMAQSGRLPARRVGSRWLIDREELQSGKYSSSGDDAELEPRRRRDERRVKRVPGKAEAEQGDANRAVCVDVVHVDEAATILTLSQRPWIGRPSLARQVMLSGDTVRPGAVRGPRKADE